MALRCRGFKAGFRPRSRIVIPILLAVVLVHGSVTGADRVFTVDAREPGGGMIQPVHGVNDGPVVPSQPSLIESYRFLGIPAIRTHDTYGALDIQNKAETGGLFPDMSRDPDDPTAYNFGPADSYVAEMLAVPSRVFFRIGYSWEDPPVHNRPPDDFDKFAAVAAHIVAHYNQGWNEGHEYGIRDWEIWNEPDITRFWSGTPEQFYDLYERTARAMRRVDPSIRVGGPGVVWWNDADYRTAFIRYCHERSVPLDFFSWHRYFEDTSPGNFGNIARQQRSFLDGEGMPETGSVITEWNYGYPDESSHPERCNLAGAAFHAVAMANMQDGGVDEAHLYRGDTRLFNRCEDFGLHYWNEVRKTTAYPFHAWRRLAEAPHRRITSGSDWQRHVLVAGRAEDGRTLNVVIANYGEDTATGYDLTIGNLGSCNVWKHVTTLELVEDVGFEEVDRFKTRDGTVQLQANPGVPSVTLVTLEGLAPWPAHPRQEPSGCPGNLALAWDPVAGANGYRIYRSEISCAEALASASPVTTVTDPAWDDGAVVQGANYCYAIEPVTAYGPCDGDRRMLVAGCPADPPAEIGDLVLARQGDAIVLSWTEAGGAADYDITRSTDPDPRTWGAPWRYAITDEDPATPGVQWIDAGAASSSIELFFYSVEGQPADPTIDP